MKIKKQKPETTPTNPIRLMSINLVISPVRVQTTTTLVIAPSIVGVQIMREGFISETGFLNQLPYRLS
jgi:hypothetical protein